MEDRTDTVQSHQGKATTLVKRMAWVDAVMADSDLDASAKCLAYALARHQNDDSLQCNPSSRRLAGELGRHERSVRGSADVLERSGWIATRGPKGRSLQFDLISPEAREPRACTPAPTQGVHTRTYPGRPRPTPPGVHARTPRASTPAEPVTNRPGTQQIQPAKALNQPQAATVETGNDRPPASVGDDVASIGGADDGFRHHALSGGCEPPQGAVPDIAEGDLGKAVGGGVDEPFPSELPDGAERIAAPEVSRPVRPSRRLTSEDIDINPEKFGRMSRELRKECGVDLSALLSQHSEQLWRLPKFKRLDRFKQFVDEARNAS